MQFHKTLFILGIALLLIAGSSCSRKNFGSKNPVREEEQSAIEHKQKDPAYQPPPVIYIPDELAKTNKKGEMYFDNEYGYRYWRFCDGKYYLDVKYETDGNNVASKPSTKYRKTKGRKNKKHDVYEDDE